MSDSNPIVVWVPALRSNIPVPAELQAEAEALDKADFTPGNGVISQDDTIADMQPQLQRITEASLKAFEQTVLSDMARLATDPAQVKALADKAKLAAVAKSELPKLNQELGVGLRLRGIQRSDDDKPLVYTLRLTDEKATENDLRYSGRDHLELTVTPDETAASFILKATLAVDKLPRPAQEFLAKHGGESSGLERALRKILFTQGFSADTLGLTHDDKRQKPPVIDEVTYDAVRDRLSIASHLSAYPGSIELQALDAGSTKTLVGSWKSENGKSERLISFDGNSGRWREIGSSGDPVEPPRIFY